VSKRRPAFVTFGRLRIDLANRWVSWPGGATRCGRHEAVLLASLLAAGGRPVTISALAPVLWPGPDGGPLNIQNAVDVAVYKARRLLTAGGVPLTIRTVRKGQGYVIDNKDDGDDDASPWPRPRENCGLDEPEHRNRGVVSAFAPGA
jgi:DNA-binding response OmpR family regulator